MRHETAVGHAQAEPTDGDDRAARSQVAIKQEEHSNEKREGAGEIAMYDELRAMQPEHTDGNHVLWNNDPALKIPTQNSLVAIKNEGDTISVMVLEDKSLDA
jgi:hypothetical protein